MSTKSNFKTCLTICVFLLVIVGSVSSAQVIYVDADAPGLTGDGTVRGRDGIMIM